MLHYAVHVGKVQVHAVVLKNWQMVRLAGAVVICDIPTTAVGNPARILVKTVKV
jgi:acetyltransferase-like isoleucine patch superfamily enzyme